MESLRRARFGNRPEIESGSGVTSKVDFDTLRKKALASALAATIQNLTAAFCFHSSSEAELLFAGPLGRLIGAFHDLKLR